MVCVDADYDQLSAYKFSHNDKVLIQIFLLFFEKFILYLISTCIMDTDIFFNSNPITGLFFRTAHINLKLHNQCKSVLDIID